MPQVVNLEFAIGQHVYISPDKTMSGQVIGAYIYPGVQEYRVQWWDDGKIYDHTFDAWLLSAVEKK